MTPRLCGKLFKRQGEQPDCRLNHTQSPQRAQSQTAGLSVGMGLTRSARCTRSRGAGLYSRRERRERRARLPASLPV